MPPASKHAAPDARFLRRVFARLSSCDGGHWVYLTSGDAGGARGGAPQASPKAARSRLHGIHAVDSHGAHRACGSCGQRRAYQRDFRANDVRIARRC